MKPNFYVETRLKLKLNFYWNEGENELKYLLEQS